MTQPVADPVFTPLGTHRASTLVVALHLPFMVAAVAFTVPRRDLTPLGAALVLATLGVIGVLQLRHSLAAVHDRRPAGWPVTFLLLTAAVYLPMAVLTLDWVIVQWFFMASALMVLPRPLAVVATVGPLVGTVIAAHIAFWGHFGVRSVVFYDLYITVILVMGAVALASSARLVGVIGELDAQRATLARVAVDRERLRISRDLHDLLGQSLSAVSLKGDLAIRLLDTDRPAARAELQSLTGVARSALRDIQDISRNQHSVALHSEVAAAATLLGAAGIVTEIDAPPFDLDRPTEEIFAWAVREGTTNVLRHSDARHCSIVLKRCASSTRLEMVNDGAADLIAAGSGIAGLQARALASAGSVIAERTAGDRFTLVVEIPDPAR